MTGQVFDPAWFVRHQQSLCAALNIPGLGRELRTVLGIEGTGRVAEVLPHAFVLGDGPEDRIATFRSRPFVASRLHREFLPIWKMLHWFDMRVANPWVPAFNLGFDTLTKYPDAGDPGTTTCDGYAMRHGVDETFPTIVAGAGTTLVNSNASDYLYLLSTATTNQFSQLRRIIWTFDTSALGSGATISAATMSVWGLDKRNDFGSTDFTLVAASPASNTGLVAADYQTLGSTSFGSVAYASFDGTNTVYTDIAVNGSGLTAIAKTGITRYGARFEWDRAGTFGGGWGTTSVNYYQINMADNASGTAKAPKLVVTFTTGRAGKNTRTLNVGMERGVNLWGDV